MPDFLTLDGNEACADVAYRASEVIALYPITPSSPMGEHCDGWASHDRRNLWGALPHVVQMQSEGGAAGALHGALQAGSLATTFTASQGLLLMIPNLYKIAGELTPAVIHVSARTIATHALSIFGDHSDVMATRQTGWTILFGTDVQECGDLAAIAHAATLRTRVPVLHCFDGFRTSHEVAKVRLVSDTVLQELFDPEAIAQHRARALDPERPVLRGTAQNPDVFFQAREACNPYYARVPEAMEAVMARFAELTGRAYALFEYVGSPTATRALVVMGSGASTAHETLDALRDPDLGLVKVRLYRPWSAERLLAALPASVTKLAVLDRCKEAGALGEPLFLDVAASVAASGRAIRVVGGRFGLGSKEFTPAMVKAVYDHLASDAPRHDFTVGIHDDVTSLSLDYNPSFRAEDPAATRALFWGLGADGTVSANKSTIKIIGEETEGFAQGYFVYDSKKSGSTTVSHLRFGPSYFRGAYLLQSAGFIGVHQFKLLERYPVLELAEAGATVLLNAPFPPEKVWAQLPAPIQARIRELGLKVWTIDAGRIAREAGLGGRINTIMQTAFFALANVLPVEQAVAEIKKSIHKAYGNRGPIVVEQNERAVDRALGELREVSVPAESVPGPAMKEPVVGDPSEFVTGVIGEIIAGRGDLIPVSQLPVDGTFPTATSRFEKRGISPLAPEWYTDLCIQCGKCMLVCPHGVIRAKLAPALEGAPEGFTSMTPKFRGAEAGAYTIQVSLEDCTGCRLCVEVCPAKDKTDTSRKALAMQPIETLRTKQAGWWDYFLALPDEAASPEPLKNNSIKNAALLQPLFEFSGACSGCGETPYVGLMSRLFGERAVVANATGCSSIYGGNLPTTPWATNRHGRGPAWSNSLFEDNAEFGLGIRLAYDSRRERALELLRDLEVPADTRELLSQPDADPAAVREAVLALSRIHPETWIQDLLPRSVWLIGGDGWAYDIGFGGLDHVLASGANVNILVLDTEVYSNTGGQASKATARGAVAKFAAGGKPRPKKDLGKMAIGYGNVYVAQVALGANDSQTLKAFLEAESHTGPSLILAYSTCIAHGFDMRHSLDQMRLAVESGHWPLFRFDPRLKEAGKNPFQLDSKAPSVPLEQYLYNETRYRMLRQTDPAGAEHLLHLAKEDVKEKWASYERMAAGVGV